MTDTRLGHVVHCSNVKAARPAPYVALEHVESGTGRLLPGTEAEVRDSDGVVFQSGDVLFGKLRPYLHKVLNPDFSGVCSSELLVLRPAAEVESRYLYYLALSRRFVDWASASSYGVKMPRTSWELLRQLEVTLPSRPAQRTIADYLDAETVRIDALIEKKRRMIGLLEERHQALIDAHVRGPLQTLRRIVEKFVDYRGATPAKAEDGVPLVTASHIKKGVIRHELDPQFLEPEVYRTWMRRGFPSVGDVVITTEAPLGEVAQIADAQVALAQRVILMKPGPTVAGDYLAFAARSSIFQDQLWRYATGSTALGIKADRLKGLAVPVPTLAAQSDSAAALRAAQNRLERLVEAIECQCERLIEHRSALITAVVTGALVVHS